MKRNRFKKYFAFSKGGILNGFAYKFSALGWLLGDLVSLIILYFLWQAIYKNSPVEIINGMTFKEIITYLIIARVSTTLVFSSASFWIIGYDIYEGNIAISLIHPINYRYRLLATSFGNFISRSILMFVPLFTLSLIVLNQLLNIGYPEIQNLFFFLISILLSFMIVDGLNFLIGQMAIFTNALFGLMIIKDIIFSFFSGSLLPSSFFPNWLNEVLKFLPFQSMVENPIMILLGRKTFNQILMILLIQIAWVFILEILCHLSFGKLKRHVESVGG